MLTNYLKIKIIALYNKSIFDVIKLNERKLSVYKYLYFEKLLSMSTDVIERCRRALIDVLIFENITKK
jgi:hypothetical protein